MDRINKEGGGAFRIIYLRGGEGEDTTLIICPSQRELRYENW